MSVGLRGSQCEQTSSSDEETRFTVKTGTLRQDEGGATAGSTESCQTADLLSGWIYIFMSKQSHT